MISTKENIDTHGWESVYVFDEKETKQPYLYSIGLEQTFNHPEVVIFGLARKTMHGILSDIVHDIKNGVVFEKNKRIANVISSDFEVMFKAIKEEYYSEYLGIAKDYYKKPFRAWIMFWPDKNNVLPLEECCELDIQDEALNIV